MGKTVQLYNKYNKTAESGTFLLSSKKTIHRGKNCTEAKRKKDDFRRGGQASTLHTI